MHASQLCPPTVPMEHARSWLLVSAAKPAALLDATRSVADATILDLEDGVPPRGRAIARDAVREFLSEGSAWVRINPAATPDCAADLDAVRGLPGLVGVMLAKAESSVHVDRVAAVLGDVPIIALVETAAGVERALDIACAENVVRIAFGTGDFRRDTLTANTPEALAYARGRLVVASRVACIAAPIDGPCLSGGTDLVHAVAVTRSMGMTGMLCMSHDACGIVNDGLAPAHDEVVWAADIIARLGARGEYVADGSDLPKLARAQRIEELHRVFSGAD